jgi:hypothetical protein
MGGIKVAKTQLAKKVEAAGKSDAQLMLSANVKTMQTLYDEVQQLNENIRKKNMTIEKLKADTQQLISIIDEYIIFVPHDLGEIVQDKIKIIRADKDLF